MTFQVFSIRHSRRLKGVLIMLVVRYKLNRARYILIVVGKKKIYCDGKENERRPMTELFLFLSIRLQLPMTLQERLDVFRFRIISFISRIPSLYPLHWMWRLREGLKKNFKWNFSHRQGGGIKTGPSSTLLFFSFLKPSLTLCPLCA